MICPNSQNTLPCSAESKPKKSLPLLEGMASLGAGQKVRGGRKRYTQAERNASFYRRVSVDPVTGCWNWLGFLDKKGYGRIKVDRKEVTVSRFSWALHHGAIPNELCVLHRCDNPRCVNPDHLFLGTLKDNTQDMLNKGRECRGERQGASKLTDENVLFIRNTYSKSSKDRNLYTLGAKFGVSASCIKDVIHRNKWKHI